MHISGALEINFEHSETHATFSDLDIKIEDGIFVYKLYDKRDKCPFFILRSCSIFYPELQNFIKDAICKGQIKDTSINRF